MKRHKPSLKLDTLNKLKYYKIPGLNLPTQILKVDMKSTIDILKLILEDDSESISQNMIDYQITKETI